MNSYFSELKGQTVVVTGGSKGLGKDIALTFAELGANIAISGRNQEALDATLKELRAHNPNCIAVAGDLSDISEVRKLIDTAAEEFGTIDVFVNNAGVNIAKPAMDVTEADWDTVLDLNLKSAFFAKIGRAHV